MYFIAFYCTFQFYFLYPLSLNKTAESILYIDIVVWLAIFPLIFAEV